MDIVSLLILGMVQGITEWIPISSKTQVTFVYLIFLKGNISNILPILLYAHVGTLLAAILYFRMEIACYGQSQKSRILSKNTGQL
ncbi:MAG: undecaprenyl-diphosphate phosphatase [Methanomicrobiales archaeon]